MAARVVIIGILFFGSHISLIGHTIFWFLALNMLRQRCPISVLNQLRNASNGRIESVLVANRGEIALRVMRTARKLNIKTIGVFSDADANAQHTKFADQAFRIGEPSPLKSYLCGDRVIDVALKAGAQVIVLTIVIHQLWLF